MTKDNVTCDRVDEPSIERRRFWRLLPVLALAGPALMLAACTGTPRSAWEPPPWWRSRQGGHEGNGGDRPEGGRFD